MPWLEKGKVLFIHVPRCGGTSITKHHRVGQKAMAGKDPYHKFGIMYYYYRYRLLENANFPFITYENLIALCSFTIATFLFFMVPGLPLPYVMWTTSSIMFLTSTFIWTAPILMRTDFLRILLMYVQDVLLCHFGCDENYLVGTNIKGYLFHLTAERCIRYGYVTPEEMKQCSFSIVRNPYSRAVSVYEYNKRFFESFDHFVRDFHKRCMVTFYEKGQTDSNQVYCHVLPMFAYTHDKQGKQMVNTIVKQEHLKRLVATNWKDSGVPAAIQDALTGIPHANARKRKVAWQNYYTQETMDLVLEMYEKDFDIFGYERTVPGREDLIPKLKAKVPAPALHISEPLPEQISIPATNNVEVPVLSPHVNEKTEVNIHVLCEECSKARAVLVGNNDVELGQNVLPPLCANCASKYSLSSPYVSSPNTKSRRVSILVEETNAVKKLVEDEFNGSVPARRATSAGEETGEVTYEDNIKNIRANSVKNFEDDVTLWRKKRAASAFVLQIN